MDLQILYAIQSVCGGPFMDAVMPAFTALGEHGILWLSIAVVLMCTKKYRMWGIAVFVAVAAVWLVGDQIVKPLVARPRPFVEDPTIQLIIDAPSGYSFPSGHTSSAFAAATVIALSTLKRPWKIAAFTMACIIAFSRLYLFAHNPSDVLAGAVFGIVFGLLAVWAVRKVWERVQSRRSSRGAHVA